MSKQEAVENNNNEEEVPTGDESSKPGRFVFPDGATYEGEYELREAVPIRQGHGTYVSSSGDRYEGDWKGDSMHGKGVYKYKSGASYEGEFCNNILQGEGKYKWKDGATYTGGWNANQMHADKGTYINKDGVKWEGRFDNGQYYNGKVFLNLR